MSERSWGSGTRALHAGGTPDPATGSRAVPIYQTTSFVFEDAANLFALQKYGTVYSRIGNPTVVAVKPLREDRARPLRRLVAAGRLRHGCDQLTPPIRAVMGRTRWQARKVYG